MFEFKDNTTGMTVELSSDKDFVYTLKVSHQHWNIAKQFDNVIPAREMFIELTTDALVGNLSREQVIVVLNNSSVLRKAV